MNIFCRQAINKKNGDSFTPDDVFILETIAHNAGAIIREKEIVQNLRISEQRGKLLMELMNISHEAREVSLKFYFAVKSPTETRNFHQYSLSLSKAVVRLQRLIRRMLQVELVGRKNIFGAMM